MDESVQAYQANDQRVHKVEDAHIVPASSVISRQNPYLMNETPFTAADMLRNPVVVETLSWAVAQTPGTTVGSFLIPDIFTTYSNYHKMQLDIFAFAKMSPRLRFQLNSTKFHQGRVICFYDPFDTMQANTFKNASLQAASGQPNVLLDASLSNTGELLIPFEHIVSYLTTNSSTTFPSMGTVYVMVLNQLQTNASTTVTIRVMLSCDDIELHLPIAPHDADLTLVSSFGDAFSTVFKGGKRILTEAVGAAANITTGNFGKAFNNAGRAVGALGDTLEAFNLDKPTRVDPSEANCLSVVGDPAHMVGVDDSHRLDTVQVAGYYDRSYYSPAPPAEMKISEIIKTKMLTQIYNWTTAQAPGTVIAKIPITPRYGPSNAVTINGKVFQQSTPTFVGYFATFFRYWRGTLSYRLDFVSTQFHTGRLAIVFIPNNDNAIPADLTLLSNYPMQICDLHEQKSFDFSSPFVSSTARKLVFIGEAFTNPDAHRSDENTVGWFYLVVYNQLVAASNVANNIDFNVYIGAGDDFELDVPTGSPFHCFAPPPTSSLQAPPSDDDEFEEITEESHELSLNMNEDSVPLRSEDRASSSHLGKGTSEVKFLNSFNSQVKDVRDLGRRYCYDSSVNLIFAANTYSNLPWNGPAPVAGDDGFIADFSFGVTPLSRLSPLSVRNPAAEMRTLVWSDIVSRLYACWSGSIRYKFVFPATRTQGLLVQTIAEPNILDYGLSSASAHGVGEWSSFPYYLTNTAQNASVNVEVPFWTEYNQLLTTDPFPGDVEDSSSAYTSPTQLALTIQTWDTSEFPTNAGGDHFIPVKVYKALGDDFSYSFLVAPPNLYYYAAQV